MTRASLLLLPLLLLPSLALAEGPALYNDAPPPSPRSPLADKIDALVARLAREERRTEPQPDARLDLAAADIARLMPKQGTAPNELIEGALWLHGIVEPQPHILITAAPADGNDDDLLKGLKSELLSALTQGRYSRVGVALVPSGGEVRVLIALQESFVDLTPVRRALHKNETATLRGELHAGFEHPEALVTGPDGSVARLPLGGDAHRFDGTFSCPRRGRYQIELIGEDRFGATVLANFPIWCGMSAPVVLDKLAPPRGKDEPFTTTAAAEKTVWRLLNIDRARAGLPSLAWDPRLADVARAHCEDMIAHKFFGHVSPTTGNPADRLSRAHVDSVVVMENVARAATAGEAERSLMTSPGHRANILNHETTHVGVGVVATETGEDRELVVTQLFSKPPDQFGPATVEALHKQVAEWRRAHRLSALSRDEALDGLAAHAADDIAHGVSADTAGQGINSNLDTERWNASRIDVAMSAGASLLVDALKTVLGEAGANGYGLGVVPGKRDGANVFIAVLVVTWRR